MAAQSAIIQEAQCLGLVQNIQLTTTAREAQSFNSFYFFIFFIFTVYIVK